MDKFFCLGFLALIVLICDVAAVRNKSSSNGESNFSRTAAIAAKKSLCTNNDEECRRNLTSRNQMNLSGNRKQESKNDNKAKQSPPMKPQIADVTKRKSELKRRLIRRNKHVKSSNASRIMPGSKSQKIQHQRQIKNKAKGKSVQNYVKNRRNSTARRPLSGKSGRMPGRRSATKAPIFLYSKKKKICVPFNGPTELRKGVIKFKTFKECVVKSKAKHGGNPAAIYTCWLRKKKNRCKMTKKEKPCNTYTKTRHYFHTKKKCLSSTIYIYNRNTRLCEVVTKSTILPRTKKIYDTLARCVSNIYKKFGTNATGNSCWREDTAGNCQKIRLQKACESYLRKKLYRSEKDCKDAIKPLKNKCFVPRKEKGVCEMEETTQTCSDDSSSKGYYSTMQKCTDMLKPKNRCYVRPKVNDSVCVIEETEKTCSDDAGSSSGYYATMDKCSRTFKAKNRCYVPKIEGGVCEIQETENTCSDDGTSSGYYATEDKCINQTFEQCYKYDLSAKKCRSVNVQLGSGCDQKDLFVQRKDCRTDYDERIDCYKINTNDGTCDKMKLRECNPAENSYSSKEMCEQKFPMTDCFYYDGDRCIATKIRTACNAASPTHYETEDICKQNNVQVCFVLNAIHGQCEEKYEMSCSAYDHYETKDACEAAARRIECFKWDAEAKMCNKVREESCDESRDLFSTLNDCSANGIPPEVEVKCYKFSSVVENCMENLLVGKCDETKGEYRDKTNCLETKKRCYKFDRHSADCQEVYRNGSVCDGIYSNTITDCKNADNKVDCFKWNDGSRVCDRVTVTACDSNHGLFRNRERCEDSAPKVDCYTFIPLSENCNVVESIRCDNSRGEYKNKTECLASKKQCFKIDATGSCKIVYRIKLICDDIYWNSMDECEMSLNARKCYEVNSDGTACKEITTQDDCSFNESPYIRQDDCLSSNDLKKCFQLSSDKSVCHEIHVKQSTDCNDEQANRYEALDDCESNRQERFCFEFDDYQCLPTTNNFKECSATANLFHTESECLSANNIHKCYKYSVIGDECEETFVQQHCSPDENTYETKLECEANIPTMQCFAHDASSSEKCVRFTIREECDNSFYFYRKDDCMDTMGYAKCYVTGANKGECSEIYLERGSRCSEEKGEYDEMGLCINASA